MTKKIDDKIEEFDANEQRFIDMDEDDVEFVRCPICLDLSVVADACGCMAEINFGKD